MQVDYLKTMRDSLNSESSDRVKILSEYDFARKQSEKILNDYVIDSKMKCLEKLTGLKRMKPVDMYWLNN